MELYVWKRQTHFTKLTSMLKRSFSRFIITQTFLVFSFLLAFFPMQVKAQLVVTPNVGSAALVANLVGMGMTVSNVTLNCPSNAYGTFSNGNTTNIGLTNGILLTTGSAVNAIGPNNSTSAGTCNGTSANDPQLISLDPQATHDPCILEFDVVPQCNTLQIRFVFGSEEYPEFVSSGFNDAFGFWITGPGPACQAGFYNNTDIATLPNNTTIVSIDNVNNLVNSAYYVDNTGGTTIQYDGFTTVLTRNITLCPCQTYHWKLAIADAGDCVYDSGVFVDFLTCSTALSATATATPSSCSACTGSATVVPSGQGPFTYSWSPTGGTNATTPSTLCPGTYTCTVNDAIACSPAYTVAVTVTSAANVITLSGTQTNISCSGGCNGTATTSIVSGTGPFTYAWTPSGGNAATASGLCAGTYTCTVTGAGGCTATQTFTITSPPPLTATQSQVNPLCNGGTGTATVVASGGTGPYTYAWTPSGGNAATSTAIGAGSYTCTITDAHGCTTTQLFTIVAPTALTATQSQVNPLCNGGTGTMSVVASGGTGPYTYAWTPSGGNAATSIAVAAGSYTCTITDSHGCTITKIFTLTAPTALTATQSQVNPLCNGGTGTMTVVASGGTGPYTYAWTPSGGNAATSTAVAAGNYTCTITDAHGCTITQLFTLVAPTAITATQSQVNPLCNGGTGTMTVVASGGTGPYTYAWTPSGGNAATSTAVVAGSYTCTITDAHGCTITKIFTLTQPTPLTATTTTTPATCGSFNGSATVTAAGGVGPYTYSWAPSGGTGTTANGLGAGSYTVTVTCTGGCTVTAVAIVTSTGGITANITTSTNVSCNGGNNGSATAAPTGGTGPYAYAWTPSGGNAATAAGLTAGSYTCTITDANGCIATTSVTITQPPALTATQSHVNASCNGGTGTGTVVASGGTGPYTYAWTPSGGNAATSTAIAAGNYTCTITDAHGCTTTQLFTITQPTAVTGTTTSVPVNCNGGNTGSATVTASGGTGPYTYSWAPSGGNAATASGLIAGNYTVTITDGNGCTGTATIAVTQPTPVAATTTTIPAICGNPNGSATATPSGGVGPYTFSWAPSGGNAATASGLIAGVYTVTVTDSHGCTTTATANIVNSGGPTANISTSTNISCFGGNNGNATVTLTGGTGPFTYAWAPSGGNAATASGLSANTYTVTVTDANGCITTASVTLTQPTALTASATSSPDLCNGGNTGSATVTASGGVGPYTYNWTPSGGTGTTANGLTAQSYTCTVTDANGCSTTAITTVTQPTALTSTQSQVNELCNGGNNASATVNASGGTSPYSYAWAPSGGNSATATGLSAGTYTCTITDANGCTITQPFTIIQPSAITLTTSFVQSTCGNANGSATVVIAGGTGPYASAWAPSGGNNTTASGLSAGSYTVTVTDANGCVGSATVNVTNAGSPTAVISSTVDVSCFGGGNGSITVTASNGTGPYTYAWAPSGGAAATANGLTAGSYTCTVTDSNGCSTTASAIITEPTALTISGTSTNINCFGNATGTASVIAGGGTPAYTYAWTPSGGATANATGLAAGTYTCTVTDVNGCIITQSFTITQPPQLTIAVAGFNVSCFNSCDGQVVVIPTGGVPNYTFAWNTGCTSPSCTNVCAGSYTVVVTDANGCVATDSTTVTQPTAISVTTSEIDSHCNQSDGSASANASGGTGLLTYQWIGGPANANYNNVSPATYSVVVTDVNGCSDTATATVNNLNGVNATLVSVTNLTCFNSSNGSIVTSATGGTGPYTYNWVPNVSVTDSANGIPAGNYQLTVVDANGCSSTLTMVVTQPPQLGIIASSNPASVCSGSGVQLSSSANGGTPAYNYTWNPGNLSGNTQNIVPLATTTYTAYVTDANGCSDSTTVLVTVNPVPVALLSSNLTSGCAPLCVNFSDISTVAAPGIINSWSWDFGDNSTISTSQNPTHCYNSPGAYTVVLTIVTADGCTSTITMPAYINVFANPIAAFGASPQPTTILNPVITFTDSSTNATTWNWSFGDILNSTSTLQNPTFTYPDPTCYQVVLTVTSIDGCVDTAVKQICIGPDASLYVPNAFTPNGDGVNDVFLPQGIGIDPDHFEMWIFDRWGNMIFYTDDFAKGWDGRVQGHEDICQIDTYVWKIKAIDITGAKHNLIGKVSIIK